MIEVIEADITTLKVDAIVNAANQWLYEAGTLDIAIRRAAGPKLEKHCHELGGCFVGQAVITPGFKLPAKWVIHAVGPKWEGGDHNEPELLATCYKNTLQLAVDNNIKTIAIPGISTGIYAYPKSQAIPIAINQMREFEDRFERIIACCFTQNDKMRYLEVLES